jgi:hypothetical protein
MANIYEANFLEPNSQRAIDGDVDNVFTFRINAKTGVPCVKYKIDIARISDNVVVYTNTTTLSSIDYIYDTESGTHTVPATSLTNGVEYKWYITVYDPSELVTGVTSAEVLLLLNSEPDITFTVPATINSRKYTFSFEYSQDEGVPIEFFVFSLYDSLDNLIETSGNIYSGRTSYEFTGFENNTTYKVGVTGQTNNNVEFSSTIESFDVSYSQASIITAPLAVYNFINSLVTISVAALKQLTGVATGAYSFVDDFIRAGNKGLYLEDDSSTAEWEDDIPENFKTTIKVEKLTGTGKIIELEAETGELYTVGHNGISFYFDNDGIVALGRARDIPLVPFYIIVLPDKIYIKVDSDIEKLYI